jgi:hypothetical protein
MVRKGGIGLDWITIKYKDIYTISAIVGAIFFLLIGLWAWWQFFGNPRPRADRAIARAQRMIETADVPSAPPTVKATVSQARTMLAQAKSEYSAGHFKKCISIAKDIVDSLSNVGEGSGSPQKYAVLVGREGSVEVKRIGQHLFSNATEQMILEDGDIVRTGQTSFARIKYHNQTFQIVSPDSLVVIQALSSTPEGGSHVEVKIDKGGVETTTPENMPPKDQTIVRTDMIRVRPNAASRVEVTKGPADQDTTAVLSGVTEIQTSTGKTETFQAGASGIQIISTAEGFSPTEQLIPPPLAESPKDQQIIRVDDPIHHPLTFEWKGGANSPVRFQISAKPLFSSLLAPDQMVAGGHITLDGLPAGTYYWRLRSQGDEKKTYWSPIYRLRLLQIIQRPPIVRNLKLSVDATPIGDGVILQGSTDPGVSVSVNDLEIPVNTDGSFSKIILFGDVGGHAITVRAFDNEGNEQVWRKQFRPAASE